MVAREQAEGTALDDIEEVAAGIGKRRSAFMIMPRLIRGTTEPVSKLVRNC